jgi:hypothetical protein
MVERVAHGRVRSRAPWGCQISEPSGLRGPGAYLDKGCRSGFDGPREGPKRVVNVKIHGYLRGDILTVLVHICSYIHIEKIWIYRALHPTSNPHVRRGIDSGSGIAPSYGRDVVLGPLRTGTRRSHTGEGPDEWFPRVM